MTIMIAKKKTYHLRYNFKNNYKKQSLKNYE